MIVKGGKHYSTENEVGPVVMVFLVSGLVWAAVGCANMLKEKARNPSGVEASADSIPHFKRLSRGEGLIQ